MRITVNGRPVNVHRGTLVAVAIHLAGETSFRRSVSVSVSFGASPRIASQREMNSVIRTGSHWLDMRRLFDQHSAIARPMAIFSM